MQSEVTRKEAPPMSSEMLDVWGRKGLANAKFTRTLSKNSVNNLRAKILQNVGIDAEHLESPTETLFFRINPGEIIMDYSYSFICPLN